MSGLYSQFSTNKDLEADGVWIEYGTTEDGKPIRIKIARAGGNNVAFAKALEKATRPHRRALNAGTLDDQTADRIYKSVFAETVVKDWQNIEDENGEELEFSKDNVLKLFNDLPDLFIDLREQSSNVALFRDEMREKDLGN